MMNSQRSRITLLHSAISLQLGASAECFRKMGTLSITASPYRPLRVARRRTEPPPDGFSERVVVMVRTAR